MIALAPTSNAIAPLAWPLVTGDNAVPCLPTFTVALPVSATVGVSFIWVRSFATDAV